MNYNDYEVEDIFELINWIRRRKTSGTPTCSKCGHFITQSPICSEGGCKCQYIIHGPPTFPFLWDISIEHITFQFLLEEFRFYREDYQLANKLYQESNEAILPVNQQRQNQMPIQPRDQRDIPSWSDIREGVARNVRQILLELRRKV